MNDHVCSGWPAKSSTLMDRLVGSALITDFDSHSSSEASLLTPRLSVMLPCLTRDGRRCTKKLLPPSGYSRTSTWAENPLTCVKKPTLSVSAGIDTWKYFAWMIGGSARVTDLA